MTKFHIPSKGFLNMCSVPQLALRCISSERPNDMFKVTKLLSCTSEFGSSHIFNHGGLNERTFSGMDWEGDHQWPARRPLTSILLTSFRGWMLTIRPAGNAMNFLGGWQAEWWTSPYTTPSSVSRSALLSCVPGDCSVTLRNVVTQRENASIPISSALIGEGWVGSLALSP